MQRFDEDFSSGKVLSDLLTRYVGFGRPVDAKDLAQWCDCSLETVYAARSGQKVSADMTAKMIRCLPEEAGAEYIRRCLGFSHAVRTSGAGGNHHDAGREMSGAVAEYVEAASDGHIDHIEHMNLTRRYYRVMSALARATSGAGAMAARCTGRAVR